MTLTLSRYSPADRAAWDDFVVGAKNSTFLFLRDYMDYHADRFEDASLVALDERGTIRALLPASRKGSDLVSHGGLTYGGFITDERMTVGTMLELLEAVLRHLRDTGASSLLYKTVPRIYHRSPADEDLHALYVNGAELVRRDILSVIDLSTAGWRPVVDGRIGKIAVATREAVDVRRSDDFVGFWPVLTASLEERHEVRPVHSLEEMELLAARFPEQIQLFVAYAGDALVAGEVVYVTETAAHLQYAMTTTEGRKLSAHDLLVAHVLDAFSDRVRYFDFGHSSDREGRRINPGLIGFKEHFGARAVAHDFYRVRVGG